MSEFNESRARSLLARFLVERERAANESWESWLERQEECSADAELLDLASSVFQEWIRIGSAFRRGHDATSDGDRADPGRTVAGAAAPGLLGVELSPGAAIGEYELVREVGRGGMGAVWEAIQSSLGRVVALKVVLPERVERKSLELFSREARAGGRLNHPNLVATFAHGVDRGLAWIAEELVPGSQTLKDRIDALRVADAVPRGHYRWVAETVAAIADGLQAAHDAGVIHRDIKPANVLLAPGDVPKVTDFGLARVADDPSLSQTGDFTGTFYYMSPEQVTAKRMGLDHRTDIFSLGVMLYELLALRRPFEGDTTHQIAEKIVVVDPPLASKVRSQCPVELAVICGMAIEKAPQRRYASMADLAADLRRHLRDEPIVAKPPGRVARLVKWSKRNPAFSAAGAVSLVALVVVSFLLVRTLRTSGANARLVILANERAEQLSEQTRLATRRLDVLLSQAAALNLRTLTDEIDELWPALPAMVPTYERWLRDAHELLEGREADAERGVDARPGLREQREKLRELHERAHPVTDPVALAAAAEYPAYPDLEVARAERQWLARMLGLEPWPSRDEVRDLVAERTAGYDADAAWALVASIVGAPPPDGGPVPTPRWGQELHARFVAEDVAGWDPVLDGPSPLMGWVFLRCGELDRARGIVAELERRGANRGNRDPRGAGELDALRSALDDWSGDRVADRLAELAECDRRVVTLEIEVGERHFERPEDASWHRELTALIENIEALHDPRSGAATAAVSPSFGWGVARRYAFARGIAARSVESAVAARLWEDTLGAIAASERYGGFELEPQVGLLPLGADPASGLFEFAQLMTGDPPPRGDDGRLELDDDACIVLVLLPPGTLKWSDDPDRVAVEPSRELSVEPFFVSKYEVTQGQWRRIAGVNPSLYDAASYRTNWNSADDVWSSLHPVEQVSFADAERVLRWLDLDLPDEAQWEYACRGGTRSAFWTGDDTRSLLKASNLADSYAKAHDGAHFFSFEPVLDDGHTVHAPIGSFAPNPFGLHDTHGNVWEWCRQGNASSPDGSPGTDEHVMRGGSFNSPASMAQCGFQIVAPAGLRAEFTGLRPIRGIVRGPRDDG